MEGEKRFKPKLTRTEEVRSPRRVRMSVRHGLKFLEIHGILNAVEKTTEQHVSVLRVRLDLKCAHHDVDQARLQLAESDDSEWVERFN